MAEPHKSCIVSAMLFHKMKPTAKQSSEGKENVQSYIWHWDLHDTSGSSLHSP